MPMNYELYPDNWEAIARAVKEEADWMCECCGKQCRRPDEAFDTHKRTLTVSHKNHVESDCRPENLTASCAPCHLKYDAQHHARSRAKKKTELENKDQLMLFDKKGN